MKQSLISSNYRILFRTFFFFILLSLSACQKTDPSPSNDNASAYSPDVIDKWITMQLRLIKNSTGIPNLTFSRYYAYSGIVAFESLAPGTNNKFAGEKWNGLTTLPNTDQSKEYFWPASVNAALASINRSMFINASVIDKSAIDSLETALNTLFSASESSLVLSQSEAFGKAVADAVFNWSETDGYKKASDPYTPPVGPGFWMPTPPGFAPASTPYWGNLRPIIAGSGDNTQPGAPIGYSADPGSEFYQMVKQVYDVSLTLTPEQRAMALFWQDIPGVSTPGHWLSILQQVVKQTRTQLDKAAWSYAVSGVSLHDAGISCWQTKYHYTLVRPITYIRSVIGVTTWNSYLTTPAHPEYSPAHPVLSSAAADALTALFGNFGSGNIESFTDHTYDYLGFAPRTYSSFKAIGEDAANSRLYAGLHYQRSIDTGLVQGRKVTANISNTLGLH